MSQHAQTERGAAAPLELPKVFEPRAHEEQVFARWERARAFHADPRRVLAGEKPPFCVLIPPPNVTGALHLGHALNNTLQDVLVRFARMRGCEALWLPGADHAGIATQTVVEKRVLAPQGRKRTDLSRDQFVELAQRWKDDYEERIRAQLRAMGCSCDYDRWRFTMDEICARAVRCAFFELFKAGLVHRGKRLVNWDPVTQTALADDEVEMQEVEGAFYYLRYPLVRDEQGSQPVLWRELLLRGWPANAAGPAEEQAWLTVATTRPETYLGDTAVAVNPQDPRAPALRGLFVKLPFVGRVIPVVEDSYVVLPAADPEAPGVDQKARYATGFLKVTPAHDPNDWEIGQRHGLPVVNVLAPDATISDKHGWSDTGEAARWVGLDRFQARRAIVEAFREAGLLEDVKPVRHSVGHSYRSHAPIEPYLSDQWYVRVTDPRLVGAAQRALAPEQRSWLPDGVQTDPAVKGDDAMRFVPARYAKMYESWHQGLRDWCVSRQLWWGHRIPIWWAPQGVGEPPAWASEEEGLRFASFDGALCACAHSDELGQRLEREGWRQEEDVLDTWFSSALWPLSTMGWPEPDDFPQTQGLLEAFNPTSVLSTAREIITLWVSRMVMANRFLLGRNREDPQAFVPGPHPFDEVYIHAVVQDGHGQRMSKSLGNGVDPIDIVHSHGADALRYTLCALATQTQDVRLPVDLVCPHCQRLFEPATTQTPAGHTVQAPTQTCPHCKGEMVTAYGVGAGLAQESEQRPLARNTSSRFDLGKRLANKLWNASRFALRMLADDAAGPVDWNRDLRLVDRWMRSRLARAVRDAERAIEERRFSDYAELLYDLIWRDFCDWRLEAIKPTIRDSAAQRALLRVELDAILRLTHPVCPFVTEALWTALRRIEAQQPPGYSAEAHELLCLSAWPTIDDDWLDEQAEADFARVQALVGAIREARAQAGARPKEKLTLHAPQRLLDSFDADALSLVQSLAGLAGVEAASTSTEGAIALTFEAQELALVGAAAASDRAAALAKRLQELDASIQRLKARLANPSYVDKAPAPLVEQTRSELARLEQERDTAQRALGIGA